MIKGHQINWNQVYYFSQIALAGSIKSASRLLQLSAPTLSEHISQLEKELEVKLFHRRHRHLVLTREGTRLFHHARQMFEAGQRLIDVVSPVSLGDYPLSVGTVPSLSSIIANRFVTSFIKKYGPLHMKYTRFSQEQLEEALLKASLDFGFSSRRPESSGFQSVLVHQSPVGFYVAQSLKDISSEELFRRLPVMLSEAEPGMQSIIRQQLVQMNLSPIHVIYSDFNAFILETCQRGEGIGVFSAESVANQGKRLFRITVPSNLTQIEDQLYAIWTKDAENSEVIRRLKSFLGSTNAKLHC